MTPSDPVSALLRAVEPFAAIGLRIPDRWSGHRVFKAFERGPRAPTVDEYRQLAETFVRVKLTIEKQLKEAA